MKICLVSSVGGHLFQTYLLKKWWSQHNRIWVTHDMPDARYLLKNEKVIYAHGLRYRSVFVAMKNILLAARIYLTERPDIIFSMGAGIAPPFFWVAWLFGIKTIYIEPFDFIYEPSLTARLVSPIASVVLVQHWSLCKALPKASYQGSIL